jgi:hypothetical protein
LSHVYFLLTLSSAPRVGDLSSSAEKARNATGEGLWNMLPFQH